MKRPRLNVEAFETALQNAELDPGEVEIIEHIRYIGIFDELSLRKALRYQANRQRCIASTKLAKRLPVNCRSSRKP